MEQPVDLVPGELERILIDMRPGPGEASPSPPSPPPRADPPCDDCAGTGRDRLRDDGVVEPCPVCRGTGCQPRPGEHSRNRRLTEWSVIALAIAISLVLALFLVGAVLGSVKDHDSSSPTSAVNISTAARGFVTERVLKGRTQVEFPALEEDEIVPVGDRRYQVVSYVDAHDPVLATRIRTRFTLLLRYDDAAHWVVEGLTTSF